MNKKRNIRNDPFGWDFQDNLEALLYPENKVMAIKNFILTWVMFIPIVLYIFLSFLICSIVGLFDNKGKGIVK